MIPSHLLQSDSNRRGSAFFPLRLKLTYSTTAPVCSGEGESLQMSRRELLFAAGESFAVGQCLQVSLDWPARLENRILLRLVVSGQILRSGGGQAAMTIDKYEFRTRGIEPLAETASKDKDTAVVPA